MVFVIHSFTHFWHAQWVHSAKCRHHSPKWTILSHANCLVQGEVQWFQVLLVGINHVVLGRPGGLFQFSKGEAVKICLASDSSGTRAMWLNRESCHAWTVAERCGCSVWMWLLCFPSVIGGVKNPDFSVTVSSTYCTKWLVCKTSCCLLSLATQLC